MQRPPEIEPIRWLMFSLYLPACLLGAWWLLAGEHLYTGPSALWSVVGWTPGWLEVTLAGSGPWLQWDHVRLLSLGLGLGITVAYLLAQWAFFHPLRRPMHAGIPLARPDLALAMAAVLAAFASVGLLAALLDIPGWWTVLTTTRRPVAFTELGAHLPVNVSAYATARGVLEGGSWPAGARALLLLPPLTAVWWVLFRRWYRPADPYVARRRVLLPVLALGGLSVAVSLALQRMLHRPGTDATGTGVFVPPLTGWWAQFLGRPAGEESIRLPWGAVGPDQGLVFGAIAFLWAWGCATFLLFRWHRYWHYVSACRCLECGYQLSGSLAAERMACPECGAAIDEVYREARR